MNVLHIVGSPRGDRSVSRKLGEFAAKTAGGEVTTLDVAETKVPYLTGASIALNYGFGEYESLDADSKAAIDAQTSAIAQLRSADVLVISAPMWNFGTPAALKAWIDLVLKVNDTFSVDADGYHGHVQNVKKAVVVTTHGGGGYEGPLAAYDHLNGFLVGILNFIGITDVQLVRVENANAKPDELPARIAEAEKAIAEYLA